MSRTKLVLAAFLAGSAPLTVSARIGEGPLYPLIGKDPAMDARSKLGEVLFFDKRLSASRRLSCASCHDLATNGASSRRMDIGDAGKRLRHNTPTVFNSALSFRLNWEGRISSFQQLVGETLRNGHLMGGGGAGTIKSLAADPLMVKRFRTTYGRPPDVDGLADALAAFMRTLVTPDARFDQWLAGDAKALSVQEIRGYALFKKTGCAACHQGLNVGANLYQRGGVFHPLASPRPLMLRVPSLRNVAVTAPYFHDGSAPSLDNAVRRMAYAQLDVRLADKDVDDLVAFLKTLTGKYRGHVLSAPRRAVDSKGARR